MKDQKINCSVTCCSHLDCECKCCKLTAIKVVNDPECPTAHYCSDYCKKSK